MKPSASYFLILLLAGSALAAEPSDFVTANAEFEAGNYEAAVEHYDKAIETDGPSAEAYYNLANAYERLNRPVDASLNYQRALVLDPGFRAAQNQLALLAAQQNIPLPPHTWQNDVTAVVHPETLQWAGTVIGWIGIFAVGAVIFSTRRRPLFVAGAIVALLAGTALFTLGWVTDPRIADADLAMVTSGKDAEVRTAPVNNSTPIASLPPGSPIGVLSPRGPWSYCVLAGGAKGWAETDRLAPVVPGESF